MTFLPQNPLPCPPGFTQLAVFCVFRFRLLPFPFQVVRGSASWRIPLGVQLIPGSYSRSDVFLPPPPRLLVAQGCIDEALQTLSKLRLRPEHEVQDDPSLQVRFLLFRHTLCRTQLVPGSGVFAFLLSILFPEPIRISDRALSFVSQAE